MSLIIPRNGARASRSPRWGMVGNANAMDRLFDELWRDFNRAPEASVGGTLAQFVPHLDVVESEDEFRVTAELPGLDREDFEIVLEDGVLTLKGEKKSHQQTKDARCRKAESRSGSFERKIRFGGPVDADNVKASYKNGVLLVTLPKSAASRVQEVKINVK